MLTTKQNEIVLEVVVSRDAVISAGTLDCVIPIWVHGLQAGRTAGSNGGEGNTKAVAESDREGEGRHTLVEGRRGNAVEAGGCFGLPRGKEPSTTLNI